MDYGRDTGYSSGNVVQVLSGNSGNGVSGSWGRGLSDQAIWATEDEYRVWSREASVDTNANYEVRTSQSQSGSDKKSRNSQVDDIATASNRSRAIGKMFHKTKLCCKFRAGTCPYITNCNFAHGMEELRKPPPNWQDIVAAHEEEQAASMEPREEFQIPSVAEIESQRSYKGRHCKKFYSEEGCPYGDNCTYLHDEQSKARESDAISLGPGTGGGYNGSSAGSVLKPSNWKTRICNKWETTGYCPFGSKCHFAHGAEELHRYGGTLPESEAKDCCAPVETKQGAVTSKHPGEAFVGVGAGAGAATSVVVPHSDSFHMGVPSSQRGSNLLQRTGQRPNLKRKGPDRISKVYGDWIDDL